MTRYLLTDGSTDMSWADGCLLAYSNAFAIPTYELTEEGALIAKLAGKRVLLAENCPCENIERFDLDKVVLANV